MLDYGKLDKLAMRKSLFAREQMQNITLLYGQLGLYSSRRLARVCPDYWPSCF